MADPAIAEVVEGEEEVEKPDPRIKRPDLYAAAKENDTDTVLGLLNELVPPNFIDKTNGWTALHWAAINGNVKMTQRLLECGASEPYHRLTRLDKAAKARKQQQKEKTAVAADAVSPSEDDPAASGDVGDGNTVASGAENASASSGQNSAVDLADEDEEGGNEEDRLLEKKFNLLKNTPLLWATMKGHLGIVWLLLVDRFSPNDVDELNNNMLHLAASGGFFKILKVGIEDGGNIYARNTYHNTPVQLANSRDLHDLLFATQEATPVPLSEKDIAERHEANVAKYARMLNTLTTAVNDASKIDSPRGAGMLIAGSGNSESAIVALGNAIADAKEWAVGADLVQQAEKLFSRLELSQDLRNEVAALQQVMPITTQTQYLEHVLPVEKLLETAEGVGGVGIVGAGSGASGGGGMDRPLQQLAHDVIARCQIEYWISTLQFRLRDVACATDAHEHDMKKLKLAIQKGQALRAADEVLDDAMLFLQRLEGELILSRAITSVPVVKLPKEDAEPGYFEEGVDIGKLRETEEYPLPPPDGAYLWDHSSAYVSLLAAVDALKNGLAMSEGTGANATVVSDARAKLQKAEKDMKLLDAKDAADKQAAIDVATKLAKKLKKGKKK